MPERPKAMSRDDADGAIAALEYFYAAQKHMFLTGDTTEYEKLSHQACGYCDSMLENAKWLAENSAIYEGGDKSIEVLQTHDRDIVTGVTPIDIRLTSGAVRITDAAGQEIESTPAEVVEVRAELGQRDGEWLVVGMPALPETE